MNALCNTLPKITRYFFHICQCLYRKFQSFGLKNLYDTDANFFLNIRMPNAFAFFLGKFVKYTFNNLQDTDLLPDEALSVIDYFEG